MKKLYLILLCFLFYNNLLAQYPIDLKNDYTWIFGYESSIDQNFGNTIMKFNGSSFDTSYRDANAESYTCNSSISDSNGNFLFFRLCPEMDDLYLQQVPPLSLLFLD